MYKTIVVHVDGSAQLKPRLALAAALAVAHGAHLVGSAVTGISQHDFATFGTSPMTALPEADFDLLRRGANEHLGRFANEAGRMGVSSWERRMIEDDAAAALLLESRYADLLVLSPGTPAGSRLRLTTDLPEYVALHGSRPVLVVPHDHADDDLEGTIVIGWDASMEATRAVAGALPLLQRARSVLIALINPDRLTERHGEEPGADLATYLARHGVAVEVAAERSDAAIAATLVGLARDVGANLLVTGVYGHSRYREWFAGGVSRDLLDKVSVPLLLAH
jgi:nucleotide-binding universal stress UspA family protein